MSDSNSDQRTRKRVVTPRMAIIESCGGMGKCHASYIENISVSGTLMRLADSYDRPEDRFAVGESVRILIDEMAPVDGRVVRTDEHVVAITFDELDDTGRDRLAADIMSAQEKFGLIDLDAV